MIVLERVDGLTDTAFEKSHRARTVDQHGELFTVGTIGPIKRATTPIADGWKNFANGLAARGAKPFADAPTRDAAGWEKEIEQRLPQRGGVVCELRDHNPRLRERYFDLIAERGARLGSLPSGDLQHIRRTRNKGTESQRSHVGHQVNDCAGAIEKQNVDWKTHAYRMNRFFALE